MITEAALGECLVLALFLTWGRLPPKRRSWTSPPPISKAQAAEEEASLVAAVRQNLRLKVGYDEEKIDRLIELERERLPNASLQTLMAAAIERWERDNR